MTRYQLQNFTEALDAWVDLEFPPQHVTFVATSWVLSRFEDPYKGVRREPGFPNLWFGVVPSTRHKGSHVATCSYWIFEAERMVRCDRFATLELPV